MTELDEKTKSSIEEVTNILERGNFQTVKNKFGEANLKKLLRKLYPAHTLPEIEDMTGISDSTLGYRFKRLNMATVRKNARTYSKAGNSDHLRIKQEGNRLTKVDSVEMTPDLAYIIGFALGDGSVQKYQLEVFNKDESLYSHLYKLLSRYGTPGEDKRSDGLWRLRLSSIRIASLVRKNGELNEETVNYIFKKDRLARKFVAAFWDAEGSVRRERNYFNIYLYNSNTYLLDKVGKFLNKKGIEYSTRFTFEPGREYYLNGRRIISKKKIYRISVPKSSMKKWTDEIGVHMIHTKKKKVVEEISDYLMGDKI